jgi:hypothetical protein
MFKKIIKLLILAPILMAFQCDDEIESSIELNDYKVNITAASSFSLDDTIWIEGKISSQVYDAALKDSIFNNSPQIDVFSVYQFIKPTKNSNCIDAIDKFEVIFDIGEYSFLPNCENSQITALPELDKNSSFYTYRIGFKPLVSGDFVVSWNNGVIQNKNRNEFIIDDYMIDNHPNQIGFNSCNNVSWRYLNESDKEYYFNIE